MASLPLAEEIRVARAAAEAAQRARVELQTVEVAFRGLEIRHAVLTRLGMAIDPAENVRLKGLLAQRDQLEPHADQAGALGFELSKLLDAQHHHLHDPGHEHTVARLKALGRTRQEVWDELEPLWQRVKVVEPVVSLLEHHTAELECVDRDRSDVADVARRTASLVEGLGSALAAIGFEVSIPDPPTPSWDSIEVVAARLGELRDVLTEERDDLQSRHAEANERHSELTAQIMAITG